jgi:hypothetical protein
MPIYEYYCPDNHRIYQFFAKTLAQGRTVPRCPDNPKFRMEKIVSNFAVTSGAKGEAESAATGHHGAGMDGPRSDQAEDARIEAAMGAMEREFSSVDENDPRAMGRMMRRMSELTGEKIDGEMEEVVRKLEEGADPDSLEEQFGGEREGGGMDDLDGGGSPVKNSKEPRARLKAVRRTAPTRDPKLYDYD